MITVHMDAASLAELDRAAGGSGVQYADHDLPQGCVPARGRIGVVYRGEQVLLHVDRSVRYRGVDPEVSRWVSDGTRAFASLRQLVDWLAAKIGMVRSAAELVELDLVRQDDGPARTVIDANDLEALLRRTIVGQKQALRVVAESISRHVSKARQRRPLSLLFAGPTGSGKTATGELLATALSQLTGQPWHFARLDMAEYVDRFSVTRLFGAPPGYIGHRDGGTLADILENNEHCVVMFDEIEKAHPDVLTSLMNLMDAGRIASSQGAHRVATGVVLIFTSNLPITDHEHVQTLGQQAVDDLARAELVRLGARREVAGRFTHICAFIELSGRERAEVIAHSIMRVAEDYGVHVVQVDPEYVSRLLGQSRDSGIGVRGVEYLVDAELGPLLMEHCDQAVRLVERDGRVLVRVVGAAEEDPDDV